MLRPRQIAGNIGGREHFGYRAGLNTFVPYIRHLTMHTEVRHTAIGISKIYGCSILWLSSLGLT